MVRPQLYHGVYSTRCSLLAQLGALWAGVFVLTVALPLSGAWGAYSYQPDIYSCSFTPDVDVGFR